MPQTHEDHHLIFVAGLLALIISIVIVFFPPHRTSGASVPVSYAVLDAGVASGVNDRVNYLIASPDQFTELWQMVHGSSTPPTVDFSTEQVLALFAGQESSAGYGIQVAGIYASPASRLVNVELLTPGSGCANAQTVTSPYEIVVIPASSAPLAHQDESVAQNCD